MKNKSKKILALILGIILVIFVLGFANSFVGNPLSKFMAAKATEKYIAEKYPNIPLEIDEVGYNFKDGSYFVLCQSPYSIDTIFSIHCDSFGHIKYDNYEFEVENKMTTHRRLYMQIREYSTKLFTDKFPEYNIDMAFLALNGSEFNENLELDMTLDIHNPPQNLEAIIWINDNNPTFEKMAEIMIKTEEICKNDNIPVYSYDIRLQNEDGNLWLYNIPKNLLDDKPNLAQNLEKIYNIREK